MAAKPKPVKKSAAKVAKKPAKPVAKSKPVAKAKAPARKAPAKPLSKTAKPKAAKPVAKKAPVKAAPAKSKVAAKAKPVKPVAKAKPAAKKGPVKRLAEKLVKLVTPAKAPPAAAKPAAKAVAKPAVAASPVKPAVAPTVAKGKDANKSARNAMTAAAPKETVSVPQRVVAQRNEGGARAKAVKPSRVITPNEPPPLSVPQRVDLPQGYRPSSGEEYMSASQLEYFRQKLVNWRSELVEESKQTIDNLREEVRDVGDDAERATRETENSLELRTRDRYRKLISKIDKALKRIEDGAYGYCEETGEEIGVERLEARPIATLCLDAQERWEHRQKLMGD